MFKFLIFILIPIIQSADPLESFIRNGWLMIRDYGEKMISNIAIPTTSDLPSQITSFQLDSKNEQVMNTLSQMMNTCPQSFPIENLNGTWHITHVSKRFYQTVFQDIHETIQKLISGKSINSRKSLFSLFKMDPDIRCIKLSVLDNSSSSPFELSYLSSASTSSRQSIIGHVSRSTASQLTLHLASIHSIPLSVVYSTHSDNVLILSQTDTLPMACDNFLVIQKIPTIIDGLEEMVTRLGGNTPSNPVEKLKLCGEEIAQPKMVQSIIRPASSSKIKNKNK